MILKTAPKRSTKDSRGGGSKGSKREPLPDAPPTLADLGISRQAASRHAVGKHAAESGMDLKAYAAASGKVRTSLSDKVRGWSVYSVTHMRHDGLRDSWRNLAELHAAPQWLWSALVAGGAQLRRAVRPM